MTETEAPPPGALRGQLVSYVYDYSEHSETHYGLRLPSGEERELRFANKPELQPGSTIDVWGSDDGSTIRVSQLAAVRPVDDGIYKGKSALIDGTKKPDRRWAFVLVDTGSGGTLTKDSAQLRVFSDNPNSIKSYYKEVSYGLQALSGDVLGPLKFDASTLPGGAAALCNNFQAASRALRPMITGTYDQYLYYFMSTIRGCGWGGVAILGTAARPTSDSFYNNSAECVTLVQEPGHNFGMVHSSALRCTKGGTKVSMIDPDDTTSSCQHDEYGNMFDPMGGGNPGAQVLGTCFHMNGVQKAYQDWLAGCNIVRADQTGTYTIYPLETACNGVQVLQIPMPIKAGSSARRLNFPPSPIATLTVGLLTSYYLELRAPVGLDRALKTPRVFVIAAGDLKDARTRGNANWLIDTTPETTTVSDAALAVGKTFVDPVAGGPQFTVLSADATKAVISVQLHGEKASMVPGDGTCSDDTAFKGPGPASCDAVPGTTGGGGTGGTSGSSGSGGSGSGGSGGTDTGGSTGMDMPRDAGAHDATVKKPSGGGTGGSSGGSSGEGDNGGGGGETELPPRVAARGGCSLGAGSPAGAAALPLLVGLMLLARRRRR